jgi:hypothetical protein
MTQEAVILMSLKSWKSTANNLAAMTPIKVRSIFRALYTTYAAAA